MRSVFLFLAYYAVLLWVHPVITSAFLGYAYSLYEPLVFFVVPAFFGCLLLMCWEKIRNLPTFSINKWLSFLLLVLGIMVAFPPLRLLGPIDAYSSILVLYVLFPVSFYLTFLGVFGTRSIHYFFKELLSVLFVFASLIVIQMVLHYAWEPIAFVIVELLSIIMPVFVSGIEFNPEVYGVVFNGFSVFIGPVCAGMYSVMTFVCLYCLLLLWVTGKRKIYLFRSFFFLVLGVVTLFLLNVLRVAVIIYVGGVWSKDLAIDLFHGYLGSVFLLIVVALYLSKVVPRILSKERK